MKVDKEKIIRYFNKEMAEAEEKEFLQSVKSDESLKNEFNNFKKVFELIDQNKSIQIDRNYLDGILPRFRNKSAQEKRFSLKPAFALVMIILIAVVILFITDKSSTVSTDNEFADIPDEILVQTISDNDLSLIDETKIDSIFAMNLSTGSENLNNYLLGDIDVRELHNQDFITPDDEEAIYIALIDKKFY